MTETVALAVAALSVVVGMIRETQFRRQRANQITAATSVDEATAANTITETVKGLLVVMDARLAAAESEVGRLQELLLKTRLVAEQREDEMQGEIDRLKAQVSTLIETDARSRDR